MPFVSPKKEKRLRAIGLVPKANGSAYELEYTQFYTGKPNASIRSLSKILIPDKNFKKIPNPGPGDWLTEHDESGQTFKDFANGPHNIPCKKRNKIVILPLTFFENAVPVDILESLREYASIFFNMEVKIDNLGKKHTWKSEIPHRINTSTKNNQVHAGVILEKLASFVPDDAFCVAAISLCDLYPRDSWEFVFGLASLHNRCGVYSLARYLPDFGVGVSEMCTRIEKAALLRRACLLMCHEFCHMFGLKHCIYFRCIMNGSNHLLEFDAKTLFMCPVCLRKLHLSCLFDIRERYTKMLNFCQELGLEPEVKWLEERLQDIQQ